MVVSFLSSCRFAIFGYNVSCSFLLGDNCLLSLLMSGLCTSLHLICCNNSGQGVTRGIYRCLEEASFMTANARVKATGNAYG